MAYDDLLTERDGLTTPESPVSVEIDEADAAQEFGFTGEWAGVGKGATWGESLARGGGRARRTRPLAGTARAA